MPRAPERRHNALIEYPADGKVNDVLAIALYCELIQAFHRGEVLADARRLKFWVAPAEIIAIESRIRAHAAGRQSATQRAIAQGCDFVPTAIWQDLFLSAAFEKVVRRLEDMRGATCRNLSIWATEKLLTPIARIFSRL